MEIVARTDRQVSPVGGPAHARRPKSRARQDLAVRWGCTVSLLLVLGLMVLWWSQAGGVSDLRGWATGLTSVGRITGLVASLLLLVQVLLMARVPILESAFGLGRLTMLHRTIGFSSFNLMVVHIVTISWGYAGGQIPSVPSTFWSLTTTYPGMLLAGAGSICLLMVVVTSIRIARTRLRYESWHLLHLYAYLGVGLALPHQLWTGQQFISSPSRTVFWWTAWIVTASTVLAYRIGAPIALNLRHRLRVLEVVQEGPHVWSVSLTGRSLERLRVEPGQFFGWRFLQAPGWTRSNPYSLSAAPDGTSLRITVQEVGDGSGAVRNLKPGTRAIIEGPFGRLSHRPRTKDRITFIGAGVGVTPLRALAEGLDYHRGDAFYLERYSEEPLFHAETDQLAAQRGLRVHRVGGRRRAPDSWLGTSAGDEDDLVTLLTWIPDIAHHDVYICGPAAWTGLVLGTLATAGVPSSQIHLEAFEW